MIATVKDTIYKPVSEVFEAIISSEKLCCYFTSYASEDIREGKVVRWEWSDFNATAEVAITEVAKNEQISFEWVVSGKKTTVDMYFEQVDLQTTVLKIEEHPFSLSEEAINRMMRQTQGWTDFCCSLKAYLYTGINLRTGKQN
jgi:uncharacterized protein YndB with AHSA1/START domain